jgi:hypothetical protein
MQWWPEQATAELKLLLLPVCLHGGECQLIPTCHHPQSSDQSASCSSCSQTSSSQCSECAAGYACAFQGQAQPQPSFLLKDAVALSCGRPAAHQQQPVQQRTNPHEMTAGGARVNSRRRMSDSSVALPSTSSFRFDDVCKPAGPSGLGKRDSPENSNSSHRGVQSTKASAEASGSKLQTGHCGDNFNRKPEISSESDSFSVRIPTFY